MNFSLSSALKCACPVLFAALLGCSESDGTAELAAGREAYELQDLKKAERLFEESLAASPDDVDRILYLARVERDLGERRIVAMSVCGPRSCPPNLSS